MKYNHYIMAAFLALPLMVACSSEEDYSVGEWNATEGYSNVSFPKTNVSIELDPTDATYKTFQIIRQNTKKAAEVPFVVTENTDSVFEITPAKFAAGDSVAEFKVNFPKAEVGKPYTLKLKVTDPNFTSYYNDGTNFTFSVTRVKWNDTGFYYDDNNNKVEGWAMYTEDCFTTFYGVENLQFPTRVQERADKPGYFRLINTYHENYAYNDSGDWLTDKDYYIFIDATDPNKVYIPEKCPLGVVWSYGMMNLWSMAGYYLSKGKTMADVADYLGTYKNGEITFPAEALLFGMEKYKDGALYASNGSGKFSLVLNPDLVVPEAYKAKLEEDFDWEEVFTGDFASAQLGSVTPSTLYKGTCVTTTDDCDKVFAEEYGTAYTFAPYAEDYNIYFTVNNEGKIVIPEGYEKQAIGLTAMGTDVYAVINAGKSTFTAKEIVLNITFEDKSGDITYGTANETLSNITYTTIGTADYTYTLYFTNEDGSPYLDAGLELQQRDDKPNMFRVLHWGYDVEFNFTWDQETNECTVPSQYTGYTHPSYGELNVADISIWQGTNLYADYPCVYDPATSTFTFNVAYYVSAGSFGYGSETMVIHLNENIFLAKKESYTKSVFARALKSEQKAGSHFHPTQVNHKELKMENLNIIK